MLGNEAELTEICSPPPGTRNPKILQMPKNATVYFGGPWHIKKPVFKGISTYTYVGK